MKKVHFAIVLLLQVVFLSNQLAALYICISVTVHFLLHLMNGA